ncbi:putative fatty-acid--CoA ligase fadD21 [Posidoniimonas corsicana]|uniref:Putative fatty-acid--CoA ligase fadD21 n=1 Tax=Posidoniimonas corsicana TaxID=1938618 RepID=A0A5C5VI09_9BACT|nr:fatty acyl-AMP ligase [Posidoniimonas corsicana]TWT37580.1 putative fatty-acid--CoA ligase fadD21 [Posidoniimonas corsicana]
MQPSLTTAATADGTMVTAAQSAPSLVHALGALSEAIPTNIAYTFLVDGETEQHITFRELDWRARSIAAKLQELGKFGDRAALVYEPGLEYISALLGCFYAGVVAVPIYPPDPMRMQRTLSRLHAIMDDAQARFVLTGRHESERFGPATAGSGELIITDDIPTEDGADYRQPPIDGQTLAFLQYTSGSTGRPKGVMLTHANLMFNFEHIKKFDEPNAVAVSWLPMYHDMGLIGLVLQVLQSGRRTVLMSPLSFVKHPARWLQAISKYRAYATSGPSFAYDLCVQKISDEELAELDLSCWTLACNGAEPVRPDTLERFAEKFGPAGFRAQTFYPCYGLAEATLIVSGGEKQSDPIVRTFDAQLLTENRVRRVAPGDGAREIVGCGTSVENQEIAIVDPLTLKRCGDDQVGEIWVRGLGVAQGYWGNSEATKATFNARLSGDDDAGDEGPFLRTGDLGFLDEGELFVTGRLKDLIIIRGRNHYPQDLERTVEGCCPALRRDHGVAFGVDIDGEERLVIVQGVQRPQKLDLDQVMADIRASLLHEHEAAPYAIVLVKGGEIPKTSSGKLQRRACKELYLAGDLAAAAQWCERDDQASAERRDAADATPPNGRPAAGGNRVFNDVESIIRELKNGSTPAQISEQSLFFADLSIESIDLVMLNEMVERRYEQQFPFFDFMAELGRQNQRDVSMGQFVEFITVNLPDGPLNN